MDAQSAVAAIPHMTEFVRFRASHIIHKAIMMLIYAKPRIKNHKNRFVCVALARQPALRTAIISDHYYCIIFVVSPCIRIPPCIVKRVSRDADDAMMPAYTHAHTHLHVLACSQRPALHSRTLCQQRKLHHSHIHT